MKRTLFTMLLVASSIATIAQKDTSDIPVPTQVELSEFNHEEEIYAVTEVIPEFPGGKDKMMEFIGMNLKYPQMALENAIQGRVVVAFVVNKEGKLEDIRILKDIGGGCGEEAVRVVKMMPDWKPGMQRGKTVKVLYKLPLTFEMN